MVSVASRVGAQQHKHEIELDILERELAHEEVSMRNKLDRDHANAKRSARDKAATIPPPGGRAPIRTPKDADHERHSEVELARLRVKHDARRQALRDKQMKEKTAALNAAPTSEKHKPQREPLPHQPTFTIWHDVDDARRREIEGIFESTARLKDDADADILNLAKTKSADRYMKPGARMRSTGLCGLITTLPKKRIVSWLCSMPREKVRLSPSAVRYTSMRWNAECSIKGSTKR
jgi:hypothetical protein